MVKAQKMKLEEPIRYLALGDSYTIGESVNPADRWPVQLINRLRNEKGLICDEPTIIATTGWRTDQLKAAITKANLEPGKYNLVSLLIGVNNQYQGKPIKAYEEEFEYLLKTVLGLVKNNKAQLFVLSIPDYGYTPFGKARQETISTELKQFNAVNKSMCQEMGIPYFYITDISQQGLNDPGLVAGDGLHPSAKMYTMWVDRILSEMSFAGKKK